MENTDQLLTVVGQQLKMTEQQGTALRMMFEGMNAFKAEIIEHKEEVQMMVQEVRDSVTLTDAECYQLQYGVRMKSAQLTKDRYKETDEKFKDIVGRHRRSIWSKLKERFEVAKYSHIRRIDFDDAIEFIKTFRPEDYL
ncbi:MULTISPECIES: ORF6C domain-containing protein [Paenibacillus]|uniref:ORF6C domain-containing protein n=1 Tax=Paenibacillus TaxID=44249 RepID=UPI0009700E45|nr:ORF6C domain-containing protein [Paenibacillus odorifer]OMD19475.1 ABC transporter permease [Paenibacillus odorifer]OME16430.1 ABC transporter permease [Paenibacillus odorifer]